MKRHLLEMLVARDLRRGGPRSRPSMHQLMVRALAAFVATPGTGSRERPLKEWVPALDAKLARRDAVIAEISELPPTAL